MIRHDTRYLRSTIRIVDIRATSRFRQNHSLECGEVAGTIAQRRHRGNILDNGQRIHAIAVELTVQANV